MRKKCSKTFDYVWTPRREATGIGNSSFLFSLIFFKLIRSIFSIALLKRTLPLMLVLIVQCKETLCTLMTISSSLSWLQWSLLLVFIKQEMPTRMWVFCGAKAKLKQSDGTMAWGLACTIVLGSQFWLPCFFHPWDRNQISLGCVLSWEGTRHHSRSALQCPTSESTRMEGSHLPPLAAFYH